MVEPVADITEPSSTPAAPAEPGGGCVHCAGTVAPDGHCWDCGQAQPEYRAHWELSTVDGGGVCDRGLRREVNADCMALAEVGAWTIGVVCDGVSLSQRPERAAQVAAETAATVLSARLRMDVLPEVALLDTAIRANRAVSALETVSDSELPSPACTYVVGIAGPEGLWASWIGDSRAYWLPDEGLAVQLSSDDTGEHDMLSAWLGAQAPRPVPRIRSLSPQVPGYLLLCTDGLWRYLPTPDELRDRLLPEASPVEDAGALVAYALDAGGHDNITALLIRVVP